MKEHKISRNNNAYALIQRYITVYGAREHNLKNIDVTIPKNTLTVITGPSGSGKSSLALDVLFTEGKRRYVESLSAYARQFLGIAKKPDVDRIEGLCPALAIEQKTVGSNPRSTVGTITEVYDYIRVLFARIGTPHCPTCLIPIAGLLPDTITAHILEQFQGQSITVAAPYAREKKGEFFNELVECTQKGYYQFIINGNRVRLKTTDDIKKLNLKKTYKHSIDILIDAFTVNSTDRARLQESIERAFALTMGVVKIIVSEQEYSYSSRHMCIQCGFAISDIEPRLFSFNSPLGACSLCHGLGVTYTVASADHQRFLANEEKYVQELVSQERPCIQCQGKRLNTRALAVTINTQSIYDVCERSIKAARLFFQQLTLSPTQERIATGLIQEIKNRLTFLCDVGLGYLSLNRTARTLSGGESQRIRLATQIGSALSGVLYILDEPSIGLHQRDNDRLIQTLHTLRDQGNTVVVVEHDLDTMKHADFIIDMGPGAGALGGKITATGTPEELMNNYSSLTGAYLSGRKAIRRRRPIRVSQQFITLTHASLHNLKNITVRFPLGVLCGISGVSGSGKSTLVLHELVPQLEHILKTRGNKITAAISQLFKSIEKRILGAQSLENIVVIDQKPIGRTPRSNPATYLGVFDDIRAFFAGLPESKVRGYTPGRFSFNVPYGRCSECRGEGTITVTMHFLPDVTMACPRCHGLRYNSATLEIVYKGKHIADILDLTAREAAEFFVTHAPLYKRLKLLCDVGLEYLKLGQPATTLSGGEAQRIKLVHELAKRGRNTLYVLDEPTTGLHASDIEKLLEVLNQLVDKGNSMIIIEHNIDVLKTMDYLIDLGPEGGDEGGQIVAEGTPEAVAQVSQSYTGYYLKKNW